MIRIIRIVGMEALHKRTFVIHDRTETRSMGLVSNREVPKSRLSSFSFLFLFFFVFVFLHGRRMTSWAPLHWANKQGKAFYVASPRCRYAGKWSRGKKRLNEVCPIEPMESDGAWTLGCRIDTKGRNI